MIGYSGVRCVCMCVCVVCVCACKCGCVCFALHACVCACACACTCVFVCVCVWVLQRAHALCLSPSGDRELSPPPLFPHLSVLILREYCTICTNITCMYATVFCDCACGVCVYVCVFICVCVCVYVCVCGVAVSVVYVRVFVRVWRVRAGHHWHADLRGKSLQKKEHTEITQHNAKNVIITTTLFAFKPLALYSIKETYTPPKEAHIPSIEPNCSIKRALFSRREAYLSSIEPCTSQKEPYIPSKEPYIFLLMIKCFITKPRFCQKRPPKEAHIPYAPSKEPYILLMIRCFITTGLTHIAFKSPHLGPDVAHGGTMCPQLPVLIKFPVSHQKIPTFHHESSIFHHEIPTVLLKTLYSVKIALHSIKRACNSTQEALHSAKNSLFSWKLLISYICVCRCWDFLQARSGALMHLPYGILPKESCILSKEPCISNRLAVGHYCCHVHAHIVHTHIFHTYIVHTHIFHTYIFYTHIFHTYIFYTHIFHCTICDTWRVQMCDMT